MSQVSHAVLTNTKREKRMTDSEFKGTEFYELNLFISYPWTVPRTSQDGVPHCIQTLNAKAGNPAFVDTLSDRMQDADTSRMHACCDKNKAEYIRGRRQRTIDSVINYPEHHMMVGRTVHKH